LDAPFRGEARAPLPPNGTRAPALLIVCRRPWRAGPKLFSPNCLFSVVVLDCSGRRPSFENPELPLLPRKALILMNLRRWNQKLSVKSVSRSGIRAEVEQLYPLLSGNKSRQKQVVNYGAIE